MDKCGDKHVEQSEHGFMDKCDDKHFKKVLLWVELLMMLLLMKLR